MESRNILCKRVGHPSNFGTLYKRVAPPYHNKIEHVFTWKIKQYPEYLSCMSASYGQSLYPCCSASESGG